MQEPPQCEKCGSMGPTAWQHLSPAQRKFWVETPTGALYCRRCAVHKQHEADRFGQQQRRYAKAKEILYPRSSKFVQLQQIPSEHSLRCGEVFFAPGR